MRLEHVAVLLLHHSSVPYRESTRGWLVHHFNPVDRGPNNRYHCLRASVFFYRLGSFGGDSVTMNVSERGGRESRQEVSI